MNKEIIEKYLNGQLSSMDKNALIEDLRQDADFDGWMRSGIENAEDAMPAERKSQILGKISRTKPLPLHTVSTRSVRWAWAACVIALFGLFSVLGYHFLGTSPEATALGSVTVRTNMGEHSQVVLPDGTEVILNSCSEIHYSQADGKRQVSLSGEAYFSVAKDEEHPFVVNMDEVEVTCLGTAYDVRNYQDETECSVVLTEGKVRVSSSDADLTMEPNSRVVYDRVAGAMSKHMVNAADYTCWMNGMIRYNDQTLEDITRQLARDFHINIIITSDEIRHERFTGFLGNCSFRNVLDILTITSDMAYHIDENRNVYIYTKNNN